MCFPLCAQAKRTLLEPTRIRSIVWPVGSLVKKKFPVPVLLDFAHHAERDFFHVGLDEQLQNKSGSVLLERR